MGKRQCTVRSERGTPQTPNIVFVCLFLYPSSSSSSFLIAISAGFPLQKMQFSPLFSRPGLCKSRRACRARLFPEAARGGGAPLAGAPWRARRRTRSSLAVLRARAGESASHWWRRRPEAEALPGVGGRRRERGGGGGASACPRVMGRYGGLEGAARSTWGLHTDCCKSGREHKSGRRVGPAGGR